MPITKLRILPILLLTCCLTAEAQRLVPGQLAVTAAPVWLPLQSSFGGEVGIALIRRGYRIPLRVTLETGTAGYTSAATEERTAADYLVRNTDIYAAFGCEWLLAGTRSRSVNLWLGATADLGVRTRGVLEYVETVDRVPAAGFLWGVTPGLTAEFFVSRSVALSLVLRSELHFFTRTSSCSSDSSEDWFRPMAGLSVAWYLFTGH